MASYFSSLLTTTTSRVATLRQNLLPSESDGDTLDDTHLCRVLRAYYTEKGRAFPGWLPPDPKAPAPVVIQPVYSTQVGASYGGGLNTPGSAGAGRGGGLSSLWDKGGQQQSPVGQGQPQSLRGGRAAERQNPFTNPSRGNPLEVQARPLPSQRAGSYQTAGAGAYGRPGIADISAGQTAAAKLRDRFKGGRSASPTSGPVSGQGQGRPAPTQTSNSYGSSASTGGNYEDRFMPPEGGYGGRRTGGAEKPFVAATSPWATNESEFGGGGYADSSGGGRQGLPGGPASGRRGPGLPSGPRGYR